MPSVEQVLKQTMIFCAGGNMNPFTPDAPIAAPEPPVPQPLPANNAERLNVPVWSWTHDPANPNQITNLKSRVRGMGMNYAHSMLVCEKISVDEVGVTTKTGAEFMLPLEKGFVMHKWYLKSGAIPAKTYPLWPLEAQVDQSMMVVFGYQIANGAVQPFTVEQAGILGDQAMPPVGRESSIDPVGIGQLKDVLVMPVRILVCFGLTCCKERNDFEPGGVLGANRVYPHVLLMSSSLLKSAHASIGIERPPRSNPYHGGEMMPEIKSILFTDTNIPTGNTLGPPLTHWDNFFDYYEADPFGNGATHLTVVEGDPGSPRAKDRTKPGVLQKELNPALKSANHFYGYADLNKSPRQGDFDNIHVAPAMSIPASPPLSYNTDPAVRAKLKMDNVAMAPFCVHDCFHTHFRWGKNPLGFVGNMILKFPDSAKGFDTQFNPCRVEGAPLVPHNQTVKLSLFSNSNFNYEGWVNNSVEPGRWHVFYHHGSAYANDLWDEPTVDATRNAVEMEAALMRECDFNWGHPAMNLPTMQAGVYWSIFYWRLRYGGTQTQAVERLSVPDRAGARNF